MGALSPLPPPLSLSLAAVAAHHGSCARCGMWHVPMPIVRSPTRLLVAMAVVTAVHVYT
jgi:hypothetical protein